MGMETNATRVEFNAVDNSLPVFQRHRESLDRVSEAYDRSAAAAQRYTQSDSQSGSRAQQMSATERALAQVEQSANRTAVAMGAVGTSGSQSMQQYGSAVGVAEQKTRTLGDTVNVLKGLLAGVLVAFSVNGVADQIDQYTKYTSQLKLATNSTAELATAQDAVRRISKDAQTDLAGTGVLYARISNGTRELGTAQAKVAEITEAVNLGLKVSGATATESASAQLQLSQAFASGTLRGEEFNAVNEAGPRIMKALADGMGQPVGALKEMASNGKITAEVMANALPKAIDELRKEAKEVQTISGSYQVLKNNVLEFVGVQSQASGVVTLVTGGIDLLSNNLDILAGGMATVMAVKFANYLSEVVTSTYATVAANRALAASNLATAQANVAATASTLALADARVIELRQSVLSASGASALAVTTNGLIPAQARATAASLAHTEALAAQSIAVGAASTGAGVLRGALAFLGGPVGLLVTVLGVAATAWSVFGSKAEEANDKALKSTVETSQETVTRLDKEIEKLKERNSLRDAVPGVKVAREADQDALARAKRDYDEALAGKGKAAGLNDVGRLEVVKSLGMAYGAVYQRIQEVTAQTEKLNGATSNDKMKKWLGENGTAAQRMAAAFEEAKKEVGVLTPEMEKLIRAKFADKAATKETFDAYKELNKFKQVDLKMEASLLQDISKESKSAREETKKWMQDQRDNYTAANKSLDDHAQKMAETNELAQMEIDLLGVSAVERNTLIEQRKIEIALQRELAKLKEMNLTDEARQTLVDKATSQANIDKSTAQLRAQQSEWTKFYGEIYTGIYDSLYRGFEAGKGFGRSLLDSIQNMFKTNAIKVILQAGMTSASGAVSNIAQAMSSDGSGSSGMGGNSLLSMGKSIYEGFSGGFSGFGNSVANYVQAGLDKAGLSMTGGGNSAFASGAGTAASYAGGAAVGIYGGRAISGGYSVTGGNAAVNIGTAIGAIWGPIGMAIGGAIGGLVNRAFGRKAAELQQSEMSGSFGESGFTGNVRDVYKAEGGWFSGDKWSEKNNSISDTKSLNDAFAAIKSSSLGYASILGLSADAVNNFTKDFKVNLSITGDAAKDAEANKKIMTDLLVSVANDMSNSLAPSLRQFAREGEQASDTLARLSNSLLTVNGIMNAAGFAEFDKSLEGAKAAERLAELAGGIEKLASGTQYFTENFLTDAEKIKPSADLVLSTMTKLGQASVDTVEEFKLLVQGLDRSSQAGAEMYAQLISIAPQFKSVADYAKEAAKQTESYVDVQFNAQRKVEAAAIAATQALEAQAKATAAATRAEAQKTYDDNLQSRLRSGKVGEVMSSNYALNPINMLSFVSGGQFDAAGFNSEIIRQRARVAVDLANKASADAINVEDITSVLSNLFDFTKDREFENELRRSLPANARNQVSQTVGYIFSDFIDASITGIRLNQYTSRGEGIASVIAAQEDLRFQIDLQTGYSRSLSSANAMLHLGIITQEQYQSALSDANKILADNVRSQESLNDAIKQAGIDSTAFYFNQIGLSVERLNQAAEKAAEPLAVVTSAIGRFTSIGDVFGMSAKAAGDVGGNADLVSQSAKIAAQVLTTQSAAQAAKDLATRASFADKTPSQLRDLSLLIEGVKQYDPNSFESSFLRISDALNTKKINQAQYKDLFSEAINKFKPDEAAKNLTSAFDTLQKATRSLTDSLLLDSKLSTLNPEQLIGEASRQYYDTLNAALGGNATAAANYQSAAKTYLTTLQENASTYSQYQSGFDSVLANDSVVSRMDTGNKTQEAVLSEIKLLREELALLMSSQESVAIASDKTAAVLEQFRDEGIPSYKE